MEVNMGYVRNNMRVLDEYNTCAMNKKKAAILKWMDDDDEVDYFSVTDGLENEIEFLRKRHNTNGGGKSGGGDGCDN